MKVRIGAIGPGDSLNQIKEVAKSDSRIELIEFEYFHQDELEGILRKNRYDVTQWIFSGQTPYYYALDNGWITEEEAAFTPLHGMGLLGTILKIFLERGEIVTALSVDTVDEKIVQQVLSEYNLTSLKFELLPYRQYKPYDEIIDFHVQNYEQGKTIVAVTCLVTVYNALKELGIPCYRIIPSQLAVQNVVNLLVSRATSQTFEKSKVVIIGFELVKERVSSGSYPYESQRNILKIELEMLKIAELLNGTLADMQEGRFYIYTTYGDFELVNSSQSLRELVKEIELQTSVDLKVGIGSGYTVYDAMKNVGIAFENHKSSTESTFLFVDENKKLVDLSTESAMYFTVEELPETWKRILEKNNYTPTIPAKIYHFVKLKQIKQFNSELITGLLKNTDRNTRRILNELEQMGLLDVSEEEASGKPGRPKKIYKLAMLAETF